MAGAVRKAKEAVNLEDLYRLLRVAHVQAQVIGEPR
jgi:hypothetical protein